MQYATKQIPYWHAMYHRPCTNAIFRWTDQNFHNCLLLLSVVRQESCDQFPEPPTDGFIKCDQFSFGSQCRLECNNGYDLRQDGSADYYTCQQNVWKPTPIKYNCPGEWRVVPPQHLKNFFVSFKVVRAWRCLHVLCLSLQSSHSVL